MPIINFVDIIPLTSITVNYSHPVNILPQTVNLRRLTESEVRA